MSLLLRDLGGASSGSGEAGACLNSLLTPTRPEKSTTKLPRRVRNTDVLTDRASRPVVDPKTYLTIKDLEAQLAQPCKRKKRKPRYREPRNPRDLLPARYADLSVNEAINRQVLRYLYDYKLRRSEELEPIMILHGPPGTGKTVAVDIIAKEAGFHLHEVRQIDGWTREKAEGIWRIATGQAPILRAARKPVCLVLDGLDGADDIFVKSLTYFLQRKSPATSAPSKIIYPIIVICNEWHRKPVSHITSAKGPTRLARVYYYGPVKRADLDQRLRKVCEINGSDFAKVQDIIAASQGDIRQSLLALEHSVGMLDAKHTMSKLALTVFGKSTDFCLENCDTETLASLVNWCFELYSHCHFADVHHDKLCEMSDWLHLADKGLLSHEFYLNALEAFHHNFSSISNTFNRELTEIRPRWLRSDADQTLAIVRDARNRASPPIKSASTTQVLADIYPLMCHVSTPATMRYNRVAIHAEMLAAAGMTVYRQDGDLRVSPEIDRALQLTPGDQSSYPMVDAKVIIDTFRQAKRHELGHFYRSMPERTIKKQTKKGAAVVQSNLNRFIQGAEPATQTLNQSVRRVWIRFMKSDPNPTRKGISVNELFGVKS